MAGPSDAQTLILERAAAAGRSLARTAGPLSPELADRLSNLLWADAFHPVVEQVTAA